MTAPTPIFHLPADPFGPFSEATFTLTGTTTPAAVYTSADLDAAHPNPLISDENGLFPDVFLCPTVVYRLRIIAQDGDLDNPALDHDPINELSHALTAEDISGALGYVPVDPDNGVFTSEARLQYTSPLAVLHEDSVGFRNRPAHVVDAGATLELDDAGSMLLHDDSSAPSVILDTVVNKSYPVGMTVYFMNVGTGVLTFTRESGVELRIAGAATNQDVAVAQWGEGYLYQYDTNKWLAAGTGLS